MTDRVSFRVRCSGAECLPRPYPARPVYGYLSSRLYGAAESVDPTEMIIGFGLAALLCLLATFVPLRMAQRRLEALER